MVFKGIFNTVYWTVTSLYERAMDALGLNVIWLREFDEIPVILRAIQSTSPQDDYLKHLPAERIGYRQIKIEKQQKGEKAPSC